MIDFYNLTDAQIEERIRVTCPNAPAEVLEPLIQAAKLVVTGDANVDSVQVKVWSFSVASVLSTWFDLVLREKTALIENLNTEAKLHAEQSLAFRKKFEDADAGWKQASARIIVLEQELRENDDRIKQAIILLEGDQ